MQKVMVRMLAGGRGGKVVEVTNLNDSGPGSLREAITNDIGARTIVFGVSGIIPLQSRLVLSQPYVTVAGQTAPGKGICISKAPFGLSGANDAIVRFIRVRVGKGSTYDGMGMSGCDYSIIDHSSISWTIDEAFSSRSARNISLQRSLISEALNVAGHQNYPVGTAHGYAASISGDKGSFHHNLLAHCSGRNWSLAGGLDGNGIYAGRLDIFNNVVYNWDSRTTDGGSHEVNFVNNYYKPGAATTFLYALNAQYDSFPGTQKYYFEGNKMPGVFDESNQTLGKKYSGTPNGYSPWVSTPFFPSNAAIQTATAAYKNVLSNVGCNQPVFDDHDYRIITETINGSYSYVGSVSGKKGLPDDENDVGGFENYPLIYRTADFDTDHDGLPDWWEKQIGTSINSASGDFSNSNTDSDLDGFTNLDNYLEWMANPHFNTPLNQAIQIDLAPYVRGYSGTISFTSSEVEKGSVTINSTTKMAQFSPSQTGLGKFKFTVKDGAGDTATRLVNVLVENSLGINVPSLNMQLKAYPNPAKESFVLSFSSTNGNSAAIILTDSSGKVVLQQQVGDLNTENQLRLNVASLASGVYFATVKIQDSKQTIQVIKN